MCVFPYICFIEYIIIQKELITFYCLLFIILRVLLAYNILIFLLPYLFYLINSIFALKLLNVAYMYNAFSVLPFCEDPQKLACPYIV